MLAELRLKANHQSILENQPASINSRTVNNNKTLPIDVDIINDNNNNNESITRSTNSNNVEIISENIDEQSITSKNDKHSSISKNDVLISTFQAMCKSALEIESEHHLSLVNKTWHWEKIALKRSSNNGQSSQLHMVSDDDKRYILTVVLRYL